VKKVLFQAPVSGPCFYFCASQNVALVLRLDSCLSTLPQQSGLSLQGGTSLLQLGLLPCFMCRADCLAVPSFWRWVLLQTGCMCIRMLTLRRIRLLMQPLGQIHSFCLLAQYLSEKTPATNGRASYGRLVTCLSFSSWCTHRQRRPPQSCHTLQLLGQRRDSGRSGQRLLWPAHPLHTQEPAEEHLGESMKDVISTIGHQAKVNPAVQCTASQH